MLYLNFDSLANDSYLHRVSIWANSQDKSSCDILIPCKIEDDNLTKGQCIHYVLDTALIKDLKDINILIEFSNRLFIIFLLFYDYV